MGAIALGMTAAAASSATAQEYPFRDITTAVVWGAGDSTDAINRIIMSEMEKESPVSISVINQTGGVAGSNGMPYVLNQPTEAFKKVTQSDNVILWAESNNYDYSGSASEEERKIFSNL